MKRNNFIRRWYSNDINGAFLGIGLKYLKDLLVDFSENKRELISFELDLFRSLKVNKIFMV